MKQVFFILFVFISFQGFSQSVKVPEIGLEVMTKDLGKMNWENAKKSCADLGNGWRLPTKDELNLMYLNKDKIGGFANSGFWSSTEYGWDGAWHFNFGYGSAYFNDGKGGGYYVRAVRTLK